jgi:hypothetical protein
VHQIYPEPPQAPVFEKPAKAAKKTKAKVTQAGGAYFFRSDKFLPIINMLRTPDQASTKKEPATKKAKKVRTHTTPSDFAGKDGFSFLVNDGFDN